MVQEFKKLADTNKNVVILQNNGTDFAGLITRSKTEFELFSICGRLGHFFELPYFCIMRSPKDFEEHISNIILLSNWPNALTSELDRNRLLEGLEIFTHFKSSTEPYLLPSGNEDLTALSDKEFFTSSIFQMHDIVEGVFFSSHLANGKVGSVSFCGASRILSDELITELNYLSGLIFSRLHTLREGRELREFKLGKVEIECLHWISIGKGNSEISKILGLSETVVRHYIENAMKKLDSKSRAHATSKALRLKIIE